MDRTLWEDTVRLYCRYTQHRERRAVVTFGRLQDTTWGVYSSMSACIKNFGFNVGSAFAELESVFATAARTVPPAMLACLQYMSTFFLTKQGVYPPIHKRKHFVQPKMLVITDDPLNKNNWAFSAIQTVRPSSPSMTFKVSPLVY